ncbi:hypothetical protein N7462_001532 [Penicillium macrosclerotiorum]|uniref:uncharacterized protein n=1 Tax=Penicillium macrosclerotiorum TaxID=303699 RepID=UPI0025476DA9|nr:uncharacterized protein N7462_001532 [Penicillium macrosclerotiorum]KAJ5692109.1 hypothetical protein N7462_001532 [Penicillium macrosclerotiorum]
MILQLHRQGIPMPKGWSWWTGHLLVLQKYVDRLPTNANVMLAIQEMALEFSDTEIFILDMWPVYPPLLVTYSPEAMAQITTKYNFPKTRMHLKFLGPIVGGPNMLSMNGAEWKLWRSVFNPGFSTACMADLVPAVVDSVQTFSDILREKAGSGPIQLDDLTTRLTMEIILKVTLDMESNRQRADHTIAHALGTIIDWHSFWDPRILANPLRPLVQRYYGHVINHSIRVELEKRFKEMKAARRSPESTAKKAKSVIALALDAYLTDQEKGINEETILDDHFAQYASYQIRLFLFAGNDTTSTSILYVYHMLSKHPKVLAKVREEHTAILGSDVSTVAQQLKDNPALLNKCSYTTSVIKESLRLFSPGGTMRQGQKGTAVTDRHGNVYPTDKFMMMVSHQAAHHNPRVWPRVEEFLPERWLVEAGHELYPETATYRPFEQGPRTCIGQTLVWNEMRIVLLMTARVFDISPAYEEWDALALQAEGPLTKLGKWVGIITQEKDKIKTVNGDRAFPTEKAGGHPADGYPCRITLAQ